MAPIRTVAFVDGFNLYHAIAELIDPPDPASANPAWVGRNDLKWLDLRAMLRNFALPPQYDLARVLYFSAFATWLPGPWARHEQYVAALGATGVEAIMAQFKQKARKWKACRQTRMYHEEKESDVALSTRLVDLSYQDEYECAMVVSGDSDIAPAVEIVRARFPSKAIRVITPPGRVPSSRLRTASGREPSKLKLVHIERALLSERILDARGLVVATRPPEYDPRPLPE